MNANSTDTIQRAIEIMKIDLFLSLVNLSGDEKTDFFFRTLVLEGCPAEAIINTIKKASEKFKEDNE